MLVPVLGAGTGEFFPRWDPQPGEEQPSPTVGIFPFLQHGQEALCPLAEAFLALQGYGMLLQMCTGPPSDPNR